MNIKTEYLLDRVNRKKGKNVLKKDSFNTKARNFILRKIEKNYIKNEYIKKFLSKDISNVSRKCYSFKIKNKPSLKILFLSDLHLEIHDNISNLKKVLLNDTYFDFIILGGDFYDEDITASKNPILLNDLIDFLYTKSRNIISILGNHDCNNTINILSKKTKLLINDSICINGCNIYGTEDFVTFKETEDFNEIDCSKLNILATHTPDFINQVKNKYDLMLSGHTHGGQIKLFNYIPVKNCKNLDMIYGEWFHKGIKGITSSGLGCSGFPFRRNILPEAVIVNIN